MTRRLSTISAVLAVLAAASMAYAGDGATSLSYISYLERYATLHPAQSDETLDAVVNMPVLAGDRLDTARGARVEVQLSDGSTVWLDEFSTLDFDAIALSRDSSAPRTALYLTEGTAAIEIPSTAAGEGTIRVDSNDGTVNLNRPGLYRLDLHSGQLHVAAYTGLAELPVGVGSALLRTGEEATVGGEGQIQKATLSDSTDDFWSWVQDRRRPAPSSRTEQVVEANGTNHAAVLDNYGDWVYVPDFSSWMWRPRVAAGWTPYSFGRWYWTPLGWNWIDYEPWGWYPSHYGSWYLDASFGWVWGWDNVWAPSWVDWIYTPGYVGWCPRGYYDWWYVHNCSHCWGDRWRGPGRWGEVAFNFRGRVHLGDVDPRPWTIVPTGQFGNAHLERVRLDPSRIRDFGGRDAIVRSGPLLTSPPSRDLPERSVDSHFRGAFNERDVPDLTSVLRREPGATSPVAELRPIRTSEVVTSSRLHNVELTLPQALAHKRDAYVHLDRGGPRTTGSGAPGVVSVPSRHVESRWTGGANSGGTTPPSVSRGGTAQAPRREVTPPSTGRGNSGGGNSSGSGRGSSPPAQPRPSQQSRSFVRPSSFNPRAVQRNGWSARVIAPAPRVYASPVGGSRSFGTATRSVPGASFGAGRSSYRPSPGFSGRGVSTFHPSSSSGGGQRPRR